MDKILLISICKEKLHYYEFVKPIENILKEGEVDFFVKHYSDLEKNDLEKAAKVIICGTSLQDNEFVSHLEDFKWLGEYDKPVFGICGGMQLIGLIYGGKMEQNTEIGFYFENFNKKFLSLDNIHEVYHLHNNYVDFSLIDDFIVFSVSKGGVSQAVKHKDTEIYGVLFHPEVRNKKMILEFVAYG